MARGQRWAGQEQDRRDREKRARGALCPSRKIFFNTRREAQAAIRRFESRVDEAFQAYWVYRCPECHLYHLTSSPNGLADRPFQAGDELTKDGEPYVVMDVFPSEFKVRIAPLGQPEASVVLSEDLAAQSYQRVA